MQAPKLQYLVLKQLKGVSKVTNNSINNYNYLTTSSSVLFQSVYNEYSTSSCGSTMQYLAASDQRPAISGNIVTVGTVEHSPRVRNNCLQMSSYPRIVSHAILSNGRKHVRCKVDPCYAGIRHLTTDSIDRVAKTMDPMQYNIFKMLSESTSVKVAQDSLMWLHDTTGFPWWSVIILSTIMMRMTVTLPLSLYQQYIIAKLENLKQEMNEIIKEMKVETFYGIQKYNWPKKYAQRVYNYSMRKQWKKLIIRENCHPAKAGILVLVQIPLWISLSMSIRNLCYTLPRQDASAYNTYQEFTSGGFLWITDLTVADPFVLPIIMGLFNLAIIEINASNCMKSSLQEQTKLRKYLTNFFRIFTIGMIPIAMNVPSCVSLYWATSSAFGLVQNLLLLSPNLRRLAGVPVTASQSQNPYMLLRQRIIARFRRVEAKI